MLGLEWESDENHWHGAQVHDISNDIPAALNGLAATVKNVSCAEQTHTLNGKTQFRLRTGKC